MSEWIDFEFERICDEIEAGDSIEVVGPQIELDLGQESLLHDVEKARTGAEPILEKVEGRSGEEPDLMEVEEAVRTGDAPVQEAVEEKREQSLRTGDLPVREVGEGDLFFVSNLKGKMVTSCHVRETFLHLRSQFFSPALLISLNQVLSLTR